MRVLIIATLALAASGAQAQDSTANASAAGSARPVPVELPSVNASTIATTRAPADRHIAAGQSIFKTQILTPQGIYGLTT